MQAVRIGERWIGDSHPVFIVAEIGINHNGDVEIAKKLIDAAAAAGCDAVKFQKRKPEDCVPQEQRHTMRETPWGYISYLEYRKRVELNREQYSEIAQHCSRRGLLWTASCWDESSVNFMEDFEPPFYKIASAAVTDLALLRRHRETGRPLVLSTGMSTMDEIRTAVDAVGAERLVLVHSTSAYPCPVEELNLRMISTLRNTFDCPIGYSGHEVGLPTTVAAVALGARYVERHITLDRAMWGSDQAASIEPGGFSRLVHYIRVAEKGLGDGIKRIYDSEFLVMKKLRRVSVPA
jgi:N-acetylneuraminate synthase